MASLLQQSQVVSFISVLENVPAPVFMRHDQVERVLRLVNQAEGYVFARVVLHHPLSEPRPVALDISLHEVWRGIQRLYQVLYPALDSHSSEI